GTSLDVAALGALMPLTRAAFGCAFFFQAEDGIRARNVTGVQTCALPISEGNLREAVTTIDDHLTALGLLGQSEWQGTAQAKKHELWPLREQLMRESNKRGKELCERGMPRDTAGRSVLLRQMLAECPHMPAAELERRIEQREKLLTSLQDAQEPQDSQTHTQDSAAEVPSMPRGAFAHTPPPLEMDSPEAARDRELLGELSASWLRW